MAAAAIQLPKASPDTSDTLAAVTVIAVMSYLHFPL
jgi:hypothetical protein